MLPVILIALAPTAMAAEDCDVRALKKEIASASPVAVPAIYEKIAACDAKAGKEIAPAAFEKILAGDEGNEAVMAALKVDADEHVRTWLDGLEPDQRSRTVAWLGDHCKDEEAVQDFFLASVEAKGADFWTERWYRGLADCRVPGIQKLLAGALEDPELSKDRSRLFNVLEVYARNLRGDAIPKLEALAAETSDEEELTYLVSAFADTTGVGSTDGMDQAVAVKAVSAIVKLGPKLPTRAVDQAREILRRLGDDEASDRFASFRWSDRMQDGEYQYAVAITEVASCKNGQKRAALHLAPFTEAGNQWPDQLEAQILEKLKYEWALELADKCKGEGEFKVVMTGEPLEGPEALERWMAEQDQAWQGAAGSYDKARLVKHDGFAW